MVALDNSTSLLGDAASAAFPVREVADPLVVHRLAETLAAPTNAPSLATRVVRRTPVHRPPTLRRPARRTIVHITAEYHRYAQTGGLAEAVAGLAACQVRAGEQVVVFVPLYPSVREVAPDLEPLAAAVDLVVGNRTESVRFYRHAVRGIGPQLIFVEAPGCFARAGLYGDGGVDYPDNHVRFATFAMASLLGIDRFLKGPVLLHAHDWHAALAPVYMRTHPAFMQRFASTPAVLSVHNAGYQGHFGAGAMADLSLPPELWSVEAMEWYGRLNLLKGGLVYCDAAVTVSPAHAVELRTQEGGFGLHDTFRQLGDRLVGICNGINHGDWDPATDSQIAAPFTAADLRGKASCKAALQRAYGLPERAELPLIGMSSRLVGQKGFDIVLQSRQLGSPAVQFIILGQGEPRYHDAVSAMAARYPQGVACEFGFTDRLEHQLMAGADALLMPSLYEPCGLAQMHAQRYGTPVIGRRVGGISDTVTDADTGFLFDRYDAESLDGAIDRALAQFADPVGWHAMMQRAMARDFDWERSRTDYADVYRAVGRQSPVPV